jgi:hypothetical protein
MERFSSPTLQCIALWSQITLWGLGLVAIILGICIYFAKAELTARKEIADGPRTITKSQESKIRSLVGTKLADIPVFIESIGDQEADSLAAALVTLIRSMGAQVILQSNLRMPKPVGILFRFANTNSSGTLLMAALKEGGVADITRGDQIITDASIYLRIGIKPII